MYTKQQRIIWADWVRSIAICCIVLVHVIEGVYQLYLEGMASISSNEKVFIFIFFAIGRLGVPFFLFLSGYLLLDRDYSTSEKIIQFWKKNLLSLLIATEIWIVIYNIFLAWFNNTEVAETFLLKNMLLILPVKITHIWYLPMILGLYLFIPLVSRLLQAIDLRVLILPVIIVFCYQFIIPVLNVVFTILKMDTVRSLPSLEFGGGAYGLLLICGFLVKKQVFKKYKVRTLILLGLVTFAITVGVQLTAYHFGYGYNPWYNFAPLPISALCFFELISRSNLKIYPKAIKGLARSSFGIYLVHNPIRMILVRYINIPRSMGKLLLIYTIVFFVSWVIVIMIGKIPKAGKILFLQQTKHK